MAIIGGISGGILLLLVSDQVFRILVPFLILFSSLLLAVQDRVKDWIIRHAGNERSDDDWVKKAFVPVGITAVYGGYFGAGQSVIILSVLGLFVKDTLTRLNALKQCITLGSNVAAAVFFLSSGMIVWPFALVMAAGSLMGGAAGGKIVGRINPDLLRWTIVIIGVSIGILFLVRL